MFACPGAGSLRTRSAEMPPSSSSRSDRLLATAALLAMEFGPKQETASRFVSGRVAKGYPEPDVPFNIAIPRTADFEFIRTLPTMLTPSRHRAEGWQKT
jgi:hypothetical protein